MRKEFDKTKAAKLYGEETTIVSAARAYCKAIEIPYEERYRHQLSRFLTSLGEETANEGYSALDSNGNTMTLEQVCEKYGFDYNTIDTASLVAHTQKPVYNIKFKLGQKPEDLDKFRGEILESLKKIKKPKKKKYKASKDGNLLVVDPADVHIGKLADPYETGSTYNSDIAVQRVLEGVDGILDKASGFNIDQVMLVLGNDVLHVDTPKSTTTSGTTVDSHGMWYTNFITAKQLYIDVIYKLCEVANTHVCLNLSNHDYMSGFFLAQVIEAYFSDYDCVTFDITAAHRKYYKYHSNLIGTTHGDGAKQSELGSLMSIESPDWSQCKHRYIYVHHVHHKTSTDYTNVTVESVRTPSGTDSWSHRKGYCGAPKAVEGFMHDKENGQFMRITHNF